MTVLKQADISCPLMAHLINICKTHQENTLKPRMMIGIMTSRSLSVILLLQVSNISMLSQSVTPMAYRSLRTFEQAIFPWHENQVQNL